MNLIKFRINNKDLFLNLEEWEKFNTFIKMGKKRNKSLSEIIVEEKNKTKNYDKSRKNKHTQS